jgi:hypothetical protein
LHFDISTSKKGISKRFELKVGHEKSEIQMSLEIVWFFLLFKRNCNSVTVI